MCLDFQTRYVEIIKFIQSEYYLSILIFIGVYVFSTALSIPGTNFNNDRWLLFWRIPGSTFLLIGATVGASILFIAARSAFGELFKPKIGFGGENEED